MHLEYYNRHRHGFCNSAELVEGNCGGFNPYRRCDVNREKELSLTSAGVKTAGETRGDTGGNNALGVALFIEKL